MNLNAPYTPHQGILRNQETDTKISYDLQKRYRRVVGCLLYLIKHSKPELSNALHELSKCMDEANISHYKALLRAIK